MNKVFLIGRLTKKPELNQTTTGKAYSFFTVAVNRMGSDQVDFIACTAWEKTAENVVKFLDKGSQVAIEGSITTGSYQKNGETVYTTSISVYIVQFLDSKGDRTSLNETSKPEEKLSEKEVETLFEDIDEL